METRGLERIRYEAELEGPRAVGWEQARRGRRPWCLAEVFGR